MKIILSGGGTLGPVTPLIAIASAYKRKHPFCDFIWVGTKHGPERRLVEKAGIEFVSIASGKFRRYFSLLNFYDIFRIIAAYIQCRHFLKKEKPDLLITAGGFVSVPLHYAAAALKIPTWVHQQDVQPGLANKLMSKSAALVTVALENSLKYFPNRKTRWIGNPVRELNNHDRAEAKRRFGIIDNEPVIFAVGGGTGAANLNKIILQAITFLPKSWHIIHLVGLERASEENRSIQKDFPNYQIFDFFTEEMAEAYASADIVLARGGFGTLTELAALSKTAVVFPISASHQEANTRPFADKQAVIQLNEVKDDGRVLAEVLQKLAKDKVACEKMGETLHNMLPIASEEAIRGIIDELVSK